MKDDFWFNHEKNNLKDIANYPCISYSKFICYHRNQMLWDRFIQQNDENKILGWKKKIKQKIGLKGWFAFCR